MCNPPGTEEGVGSSTTKNAAPQAVRTEGTVDLNPMEADWGDDDTSSGAMPSAWTTNLPLQKEGRLEEMSSSLATALSTRPTHCDYYWPWGPQRRPSELRGEAHGPESQVAAFAANRGETAEGEATQLEKPFVKCNATRSGVGRPTELLQVSWE